jgi:23S rRNA C2498 (ribose-2'-O)-methylase RlmM
MVYPFIPNSPTVSTATSHPEKSSSTRLMRFAAFQRLAFRSALRMFVDSIPNFPVQAKIQPQLTMCFVLKNCHVSLPIFWSVEVLDMNDIKRALSFHEQLGEDDFGELQDEGQFAQSGSNTKRC